MTRAILLTIIFSPLAALPSLAVDKPPVPLVCSELSGEGIPSACLEALKEQYKADCAERRDGR